MPPTRYANYDFNQQRITEKWSRIDQLNSDFQSFSRFVNDPASSAHRQFGPYAMAQVKSFLPEVEKEVGPGSTHRGAFTIFLDQGSSRNFVSLLKDDTVAVWSCWQTQELEQQHRAVLDGAGCLAKLAAIVNSTRPDIRVQLVDQSDKSLMWKAATVHPLQVRENAYQRVVVQAGRDADDPLTAQSEKLAEFFAQDGSEPAYLRTRAQLETYGDHHLASVSMNHLIDGFYLFRLLVKYRIESPAAISEDVRAGASSDLTKLLHNGDRARMAWLSGWLTQKIAELASELDRQVNAGGPRRVIFFLKGGRALNYFLRTPEKGENDWDTQVVIDPHLPAEEWYRCLAKVHDVLLSTLLRFKQEFTGLVDAHAAEFAAYLEQTAPQLSSDDEEADDNEASDVRSGDTVHCKAELIDIGIPRRDSPSGLEEWTRLSAPHALMTTDGIVYPHREYYLNEYLMMIREAFRENADVAKSLKRITRFGLILESAHDGPSALETQHLAAVPEAMKRVAALESTARRTLYRLVLAQFVDAYNLRQDTDLAAHVDRECAALMAALPPLPPKLATLLNEAQTVIASDIGVAHALSVRMDRHWAERNAFFERESDFFRRLALDLFQATREPLQRVQSQFALAGSYAARLQARHLRATTEGLEPVRRLLCKLQCPLGADRTAVMRAVADQITTAAANTKKLRVVEGDKQSLLFYWSEQVQIGDLTYAPLVVKVRVAEQTGSVLPVLSSLDGLPVLDLRYLAADYMRKTSKVDEGGSRSVLASATGAVSEMLSRFDFDSDDEG